MKFIKNERGFTLIEMMIVLLNYFGVDSHCYPECHKAFEVD